MRRSKLVSLGILSSITLLTLGVTSGCGDTPTNAPLTEEAKKVDQGVQNGMKDFMQQKTQSKAKTK